MYLNYACTFGILSHLVMGIALKPPPKGDGPPPPAAVVPALPPHTPGVCSFHMTQFMNICGKATFNDNEIYDSMYTCQVGVLRDGVGNDIGSSGTNKEKCNDKTPMNFYSRLPSDVIITAEEQGDYIQFAYQDKAWKSGDLPGKDKVAWCNKPGKWDPMDLDPGLECIGTPGGVDAYVSKERTRQMDCFFHC